MCTQFLAVALRGAFACTQFLAVALRGAFACTQSFAVALREAFACPCDLPATLRGGFASISPPKNGKRGEVRFAVGLASSTQLELSDYNNT